MRYIFVLSLLLVSTFSWSADEKANGFVKTNSLGELTAWSSVQARWVSLDDFWANYSRNNKNRHWGTSTKYPDYAEVQEFDTFLVQTSSGTCLMEFFHTRWRRSNDVNRWDEKFNDYSGCANAFE